MKVVSERSTTSRLFPSSMSSSMRAAEGRRRERIDLPVGHQHVDVIHPHIIELEHWKLSHFGARPLPFDGRRTRRREDGYQRTLAKAASAPRWAGSGERGCRIRAGDGGRAPEARAPRAWDAASGVRRARAAGAPRASDPQRAGCIPPPSRGPLSVGPLAGASPAASAVVGRSFLPSALYW